MFSICEWRWVLSRLSSLILLLLTFVLSACSATYTEADTEASPPTKLIKPQPCHAMPPIQDTTKLEASLRARGIITSDMDEEQAKAKVAEYISKRRKAYDACRKGS